MNELITERIYPIENKLLTKTVLSSVVGSAFLSFYIISKVRNSGVNLYIITFTFIGFGLISFVTAWLWRANFYYTLNEKFITVRQGIISKKQRDLPYGVIQNIYIKQDLLDRLLGLASITVENASMGGGQPENKSNFFGMKLGNNRQKQGETYGLSGNKIGVPGLTKANAELLKGAILQKMNENPLEETHSGL